MGITAEDVKKLRDATGVGMMDAKKALAEAGGDFDAAIEALRKSGAAKAAKKADRIVSEGYVASYIHGDGRIGVLLELSCETDFVARNEAFQALAHDIALHIAAMQPLYIAETDIPEAVVAKEREIYVEQLTAEGKPADRLEAIVEGKLNKYFEEVVLTKQTYVKDDTMTIGELIERSVHTLGENIQIARFARFAIAGSPNVCRVELPDA